VGDKPGGGEGGEEKAKRLIRERGDALKLASLYDWFSRSIARNGLSLIIRQCEFLLYIQRRDCFEVVAVFSVVRTLAADATFTVQPALR
jgi:hypothetical protein